MPSSASSGRPVRARPTRASPPRRGRSIARAGRSPSIEAAETAELLAGVPGHHVPAKIADKVFRQFQAASGRSTPAPNQQLSFAPAPGPAPAPAPAATAATITITVTVQSSGQVSVNPPAGAGAGVINMPGPVPRP